MKSVGVRNLKNSLSKYLRMVRSGDILLVTDREEVIAQISPPSAMMTGQKESADRTALVRLAALGKVRLGKRKPRSSVKLTKSLSQEEVEGFLNEARGDRTL